MRGDTYQVLLIFAGVVVAALFGAFLYREIYPEYKIYQNDYVALEEFRSTYTNQPLPPFQFGVKQIVLEREDNGPAVIDRCTSCHVALQIPYFSPTKIAHDVHGDIVRDAAGSPVKVPNENFIWQKLDEKIAELRDKKVLEHLESTDQKSEAAQRLDLAAKYEALKTAHVGENVYDVSKVLAMHPLMGSETYPFEYHPVEEYGCTSCHNGNGRGLVTVKAHGPVFDDQYEIEDLGPVPRFTEHDPENDPPFARIFNHKPGESLVFQTEPIFVGSLIQAKCVQCHQTTPSKNFQTNAPVEENAQTKTVLDAKQQEKQATVDRLTSNYQKGKELYISQACYACHRISGFARGGVGPELTFSGNSYPWYLKRKLVWPQGDLATSTMPNMRFDHGELEDLMTFLLAQKGNNNSMGKTAYKSALLAWEAGKKLSWEAPVAPAQLYDLNSSMTIFATEGCAACHRLQGFESNVGFAIEKAPHTFNQLYEQQHWFRQLFPEVVHISQYDEELPGSDIVGYIEKHAKEIDERIVSDVRKNSLLEAIDQSHPGVIESYYSPFHYASRAKNQKFKNLLDHETDPEKRVELNKEWEAWKERVHRVLMTYIQLYGLGRIIGPHLNWSGIFRTDEWLMEHFRNPSGHVPRSLMPVFPFDDSKFYALTYMLDQLAVRNRTTLRQMWTEHGFDPSETYNMLCAQCHGIDRVGNGAIAEWIYPIPKNLHNAEFLRNLTKEKALYSLMHGVKGTPMPPWGEAAPNKPEAVQKMSHQIPVMNASEIRYLVNWLFSSLPGGEVIREASDVPKWQYSPEDVLEELKKEGGELLPESKQVEDETDKAKSPLSFLPTGKGLYAALQPTVSSIVPEQKAKEQEVDAVFRRVQTPTDTGNESYYIKKEYYTPQNIDAGKEFFLANCAVCHGNEADGNSLRSGVMQEAKPRILTNLDWIQSRDDLRLLRSIKYGIPGTAMTPWGDFTNSLQRLQLVIFIRSLSSLQERRDSLTTALYQVYDNAQFVVEHARIENSQQMEKLKNELENIRQKSEDATKMISKNKESLKSALEEYEKALEWEAKLGSLREVDQKFLDLEASLKSEKTIYFNLGTNLISKDVSEDVFQNYLEIIRLNGNRYSNEGNRLNFLQDGKADEKIRSNRQVIINGLNREISTLEKKKEVLAGKIHSAQRESEIQSNQAEIDAYKKLRDKLITDTQEALRLVVKQNQIVQSMEISEKSLSAGATPSSITGPKH